MTQETTNGSDVHELRGCGDVRRGAAFGAGEAVVDVVQPVVPAGVGDRADGGGAGRCGDALRKRQRQAWHLFGRGFTLREIGAEMGLTSVSTVPAHLHGAATKLGPGDAPPRERIKLAIEDHVRERLASQ